MKLKNHKLLSESLDCIKELLNHAEWMSCAVGYTYNDLKPMFDRAEKMIKKLEKESKGE